jgi:hypothetical protein
MLRWIVSRFVSGIEMPDTVIKSFRLLNTFWSTSIPDSPIMMHLDLCSLGRENMVRFDVLLQIFGHRVVA